MWALLKHPASHSTLQLSGTWVGAQTQWLFQTPAPPTELQLEVCTGGTWVGVWKDP